MPQVLSGQVFRQWAPRRLLRLGRGLDCRGDRRRCRRELFRLVSLQGLERQLELLGVARQLLRGTAKLDPPIPCQLESQPGDLGLGGQRILRHSSDDALQRSGVVGQAVGRDLHARSGSDLQRFGSAKPLVESICRSLSWPGSSEEAMNWGRRLAVLFVILALTGCAQGVTGQPQIPSAPYSPENNGNMHDGGGGGGGG